MSSKQHYLDVSKLTGEVGERATPLDTSVTRPHYYGGADDPYEPIKVLEAWLTPEEFRGWLKGTILKYIRRAGQKGTTADDVAKAAWYSRYLSEWEKRQEIKSENVPTV